MRTFIKTLTLALLTVLIAPSLSASLTVNVDFSRDTTDSPNPSGNEGPVLYSGVGPSVDTGTSWNDFQVQLTGSGSSVPAGQSFSGVNGGNTLIASDGTTDSGFNVTLTSGFYRSFNGGSSGGTTDLFGDRVFSNNSNTNPVITISGLDPTKTYDIYAIVGNFNVNITSGATTKTVSGSTSTTFTEDENYALLSGLTPDGSNNLVITIDAQGTNNFGAISGLQIVEIPNPSSIINVDFGPTGSTTYTGQGPLTTPANPTWNNVQPAAQLTNINNPYLAQNLKASDGTDTVVDVELTDKFYRAFGDGGTTSLTGDRTFSNSSNTATLTIKDLDPTKTHDLYLISGNYNVTYTSGENSATVTGSSNATFTNGENYGLLTDLVPDASGNLAITITPEGGNATGVIAGLQIIETGLAPPAPTATFTSSATFVQKPATIQLSWTVPTDATTVEITPGIGSVLPQTTDGAGSINVSPIGNVEYQLIVDGEIAQTIPVTGLPVKSKVHLYLFIGQSNMAGSGRDFDANLDAPIGKVLQYGSRGGMEDQWVLAQHPLTSLGGGGNAIGMGLEFAKTLLAQETDPEVVIGIINHAVGSTAIQFWEPGAIDNRHPGSHKLYDEAIQRTLAAKNCGTVKAVLWHQGEYNTNRNSNPSSDPDGYAARLQTLVENLRTDLADPALPFICGKLVPRDWENGGSTDDFTGLPDRIPVETALADLPNHKSNTFCVENNGLRGHGNEQIHFDAPSQRLLGQRYANALININADPLKKYLGGYYNPTQLDDPNIASADADPDNDHLTNLQEFAFLTNPSETTKESPIKISEQFIENEGTYPTFEYKMRQDENAPNYTVESSIDLSTWNNNQNSPSNIHLPLGAPTDNQDGTFTQKIRFHLPYTQSPNNLFFQLKLDL